MFGDRAAKASETGWGGSAFGAGLRTLRVATRRLV